MRPVPKGVVVFFPRWTWASFGADSIEEELRKGESPSSPQLGLGKALCQIEPRDLDPIRCVF